MEEKNPKIIGITGSICSGKSAVSEYLRTKNYIVLDMDAIAKEQMTSNSELMNNLKKAFGEDVYLSVPDSKIELNTKYLATIVFKDEKRLNELNSLVHPIAIEATMELLEKLTEEDHNLIFVENALLFEMGLDDGFDFIIAINAPENIRQERAIKRGLSAQDFKNRQKSQIDDKEKCECSDFVIDNGKTLEGLYSTVDFIVDIIAEM